MSKKILYWLSVLLLLSFLFFVFVICLKLDTFPLINMAYKVTPQEFNSLNQLDFDIPLSEFFKNQVYNDLFPLIKDKDAYTIAVILTRYVRSHLYHVGTMIHSVEKILITKHEDKAMCGGYSKLFASVAQSLGYKSRVIWTNGHTVSEIYFPEYGWVLVDTNGNIIFQDKQGEPVSLVYVVDHFDEVIPVRLDVTKTMNDPDYLSSDNHYVYKNNDILVALEGKRLLDFDLRMKSPLIILQYLLKKDDIAKGIQYIGRGRRKLGNYHSRLILFILFETLLAVTSLLVYRFVIIPKINS